MHPDSACKPLPQALSAGRSSSMPVLLLGPHGSRAAGSTPLVHCTVTVYLRVFPQKAPPFLNSSPSPHLHGGLGHRGISLCPAHIWGMCAFRLTQSGAPSAFGPSLTAWEWPVPPDWEPLRQIHPGSQHPAWGQAQSGPLGGGKCPGSGSEDTALPPQGEARGTGLDGRQPQPRPPSPHPAPAQSEAVEMMDQIVRWVREDPSGLGRPQLPGALASASMAVPMMLLNLVEQLGESDEDLAGNYAELGDWCAQRILQHVQVGSRRLTPGPDGAWAPGGRATPTAQGASSNPTPPRPWALMGRHRGSLARARGGPGPSGRRRAQGAWRG